MNSESKELSLVDQQHEAERNLIACAFIEPAVTVNYGYIRGDMFIDKELGWFWDKLKDEGVKADPVTIASEKSVDFLSHMIDLTTGTFVPVSAASGYASAMSKVYTARVTLSKLSDVAKKLHQLETTEALKILADTVNIAPMTSGMENGGSTWEISGKFIQEIEEVEKAMGIQTYISQWDRQIGFMAWGDAVLIGARPSMGKSTLANQIARNVAAVGKKKAVIFAMEQTRETLWARWVAARANIPVNVIRSKRADIKDQYGNPASDEARKKGYIELIPRIQDISNELSMLYEDRLYIYDDVYSIDEMHRVCLDVRPQLIVVDYLDLAHAPYREQVKTWRSDMLREIKEFCKRLDIVPIVVVQLNRGVESRDDKRPKMSDIQWDGGLEQAADIIVFLYREDYYDDGLQVKNSPTDVIVRKNRMNALNISFELEFDLEAAWFK